MVSVCWRVLSFAVLLGHAVALLRARDESDDEYHQEYDVHVTSIGGVGTTSFIKELNMMTPPISTNNNRDLDTFKHLPFSRLIKEWKRRRYHRPKKIIYLYGDPVHALQSLEKRHYFYLQLRKVRSDRGGYLPRNLKQYIGSSNTESFQLEQHFDSFHNQCVLPVAFLRIDEKADHPDELADFLNVSSSEIRRGLEAWKKKRLARAAAERENFTLEEEIGRPQRNFDNDLRARMAGVIKKYADQPGWETIIPGKDCVP